MSPTNNRISPAHSRPHPASPFARARPDPDYEFDLSASHFPSPSKQHGSTRPRHTLRTGTLAGAYRAASRRPAMTDEDLLLAGMASSSPRRNRQEFINALSPSSQPSNPPEELVDVYKRIEEDGTLANYVRSEEDWPEPAQYPEARPASTRISRSTSRTRERNSGVPRGDGPMVSDTGFHDDTGNSVLSRRRISDTRDEQRLRRVTGTDSPIFSRAHTGRQAALTADNLQRRDDEDDHTQPPEEDGDRGPSLNLPSTWGSRASRRQEWLRNVSSHNAPEQRESESILPRTKTTNETIYKPLRASPRPSERSSLPTRSALGERTANPLAQDAQDEKKADGNASSGEGNPIPNTPIVVYKNSAFNKPSTIKRDSQDLLRRLSRTESPKLDQIATPDPPKLFERRVYDKTPRVTGAWIDTPVTERVTEIPKNLTKDIVPKPVSEKEKEKEPAQEPKSSGNDDINLEAQPTKRSRPPLIRPKLPKSALETVMEDFNSGKEPLDMGDDTINSLQLILDDSGELKTEEEDDAAYEKTVLEKLELANASENKDLADIDRLNQKLLSLRKNINEVRKGLDGLDGQVQRERQLESQSKENGQHMQSGRSYHDGRVYAAIPLPRLWERHPISRRLQLTKLGLVTFVSLTWYVVECIMCEQYCHPVISDSCEGYCLQPDAPHFPWVTVTMLWRWSHLSTLLAPVITVTVAIFRLVAQLLGLSDGYVDDGPAALGNLVGEIRINGTPVSFPWLSSPSAQSVGSSEQQQQQPVWTERIAPPPARAEDDQISIDDDEYL
ncbi:hypothetical protein N7474_009586 [Penicillium riverlandense]|uniref:uncharacterized protein n=1 Tax=Penicillium riverlandense TaxID=1903569 RepID=UPI00254708A3|nr:uncharacterized protein N7474_009586 [Penicillium riverlandense]KAJ5808317.1 hypothetical protein N7474_009586 [Penicillium riverlandense]